MFFFHIDFQHDAWTCMRSEGNEAIFLFIFASPRFSLSHPPRKCLWQFFFFSPSLPLHSVSDPPVELGECDFSKGVSIGLQGCSSGRSEGASQTFHLRSYVPEGLCGLERQLACQVASCAMKAQLLLYCFLIEKNTHYLIHWKGWL